MITKTRKDYAKVTGMYHAMNGLVRYAYKDPATWLQKFKFITKAEAFKMGVWAGN